MPSPKQTARLSLVILLFLGIVLTQCQKKQEQTQEQPAASAQSKIPPSKRITTPDTAKVALYIQQQVENLLIGEKVILSGDSVFSKKVLPQLYQNRGFRPAWLDTAYAATLLKAIAGAD